MANHMKYSSPEELQERIDAFFEAVENGTEKMTIGALTLFLNFGSRSSILGYCKREDDFGHVMNTAVTRIEAYWEAMLLEKSCTGAIFWLKNRGWTDRQDVTSGDAAVTPAVNIIMNGKKVEMDV
ncbi:MAG TPA: hypothetical protein HPP87_10495 [Planctomycetes bacterium]|nr:hypothetical protein [Planctomycetota bacterium]